MFHISTTGHSANVHCASNPMAEVDTRPAQPVVVHFGSVGLMSQPIVVPPKMTHLAQ